MCFGFVMVAEVEPKRSKTVMDKDCFLVKDCSLVCELWLNGYYTIY